MPHTANTVGHISSGSTWESAHDALDVHAHAMPLPLLQWLADRGLADLDGVPEGIVRLDPQVSGVGPRAPLPLARSQFDVDVRLSEMDEVGVYRHAVSLPPFLFASTATEEKKATGIVARGNDDLATYVGDGLGKRELLGAGLDAILGVAALLDAAIAGKGTEALLLEDSTRGVHVEELDLRDGGGAHEAGGVVELRADFHADGAGYAV